MHGRLFSLLDVPLPSYFVLLVIGFLFATALGVLWARRVGHDPDVVVDLGLGMLLFGTLGARLLHVLADGMFWDYVNLCVDPGRVAWKVPEATCSSEAFGGVWDPAAGVCRPPPATSVWMTLDYCTRFAQFWQGGLTYYGGFIGAVVAARFMLRRDRFPYWKAADMAGMAVPLGLAFGRMGCFLAGCCFGVSSDVPWALSFPAWSPASEQQFEQGALSHPGFPSLPVHPTQLYEAVGSLAIAAYLAFHLHGRKRYDGQVFVAFLALYAVLRFVLEIFRNDDRGGIGVVSTSQWVGLLILGAAVLLHRHLAGRAQAARAAATASP